MRLPHIENRNLRIIITISPVAFPVLAIIRPGIINAIKNYFIKRIKVIMTIHLRKIQCGKPVPPVTIIEEPVNDVVINIYLRNVIKLYVIIS
jgi:hypothetical protein